MLLSFYLKRILPSIVRTFLNPYSLHALLSSSIRRPVKLFIIDIPESSHFFMFEKTFLWLLYQTFNCCRYFLSWAWLSYLMNSINLICRKLNVHRLFFKSGNQVKVQRWSLRYFLLIWELIFSSFLSTVFGHHFLFLKFQP